MCCSSDIIQEILAHFMEAIGIPHFKFAQAFLQFLCQELENTQN